MDEPFKIKKKVKSQLEKQKFSLENSEDDAEKRKRKSLLFKKFSLLEINTDKIFESILEEASRDPTIYTTIAYIINLGRKELVTVNR
jgi:hypothetical protein